MWTDSISRSGFSWTACSTVSTIFSTWVRVTGLFSHAFSSPFRILFRSNRSRPPSFLTTM